LIRLIHNDCSYTLRRLQPCSIHSMVTDPPAGISFMGKDWDGDHQGRDRWIKWFTMVMKDCYRVLKPGAHAFVWALPRTSHWTATALEDAGFEIRDVVTHLFGCLSEDSEILTAQGWKNYKQISANDVAVCYNIADDTLSFGQIKEVFTYDYADTAYRLVSDKTDQIVSRNHRCIVERGGRKVFALAETLECQATVPILEDVSVLQDALRLLNEGTGDAAAILSGVSRPCDFESENGSAARATPNLPDMQEGVHTEGWNCARESQDLFLSVSGCDETKKTIVSAASKNNRMFGAGRLDQDKSAKLSCQDDWREKPSMEGRGDLQTEQGELHRAKVCAVSGGASEHVEDRWLRYGTSSGSGTVSEPAFTASRVGPSHQSQNPRQSTVEPHALSLESGSQTVRASRFTTSDVVRVEAMPYIGKVWCVSVPTGAFIARRNGKAFITGNSGFPKSLDISKAIDKAAGAEREVIGELTRFDGKPAGKIKPMNGGSFASNAEKEGKRVGISTPSTDAAKQWEGWGTALKPAAEFWILVRKPCSEKTVAENVLRWGTGGINIDQTRIKPANAIPLRKNLSQLILPTFYADMPVSLPGSFSDVCALSLRHVQGFLKRTFSVLDSGSICDTNLWPNVVREFRNLYKLPKVSACDCGPTVWHEVLYAQRLLKAQDSKSYYPILSHFYDALSHGVEGCDEGDFPLLADVRACISDLPNSQENIPLNDSNLHLFCVWAFSWCLYSAIRHDVQSTGRFPSNLLLDESAAEMLDEQSGLAKAKRDRTGGGVSRFFYVAKTSSSERNAGCEDMPDKILATSTGQTRPNKPARLGADPFAVQSPVKNNHPTVKPLKLMRYLCRLITPPGGTVLDPFMGSGSTGIAAVKEGFSFIGIEKEKEYFEIAKKRIGT